MSSPKQKLISFVDLLLSPVVYLAALLLRRVREVGISKLPRAKKALLAAGVFPIRNHYYEPLFDTRELATLSPPERNLPAIDWNIDGQLTWLEQLNATDELAGLEQKQSSELDFHLDNGAFVAGDAEYWYQLIRHLKPQRIIEVGSGHSTLMGLKALRQNKLNDSQYQCQHICIEPYEMPWLERVDVQVERQKVEDLPLSFFSKLQANDILFIDSSHIVRPQGDVLFEYLELFSSLNKGVIVHIHDIFSPRDYPAQWLKEEVRLWNEQYLLEAFLSHNRDWEIIASLNHLRHHHFEQLKRVAPFLRDCSEPGSFYIRKIA